MLYFAYAADLWVAAATNWSRDRGGATLRVIGHGPATLPNHRLAFPAYNEFWRGGEGAVVASPGKQVSGVLLELTAPALEAVDRRVGRGLELALASVRVLPYRGGEVRAFAYRPTPEGQEGTHVPPTADYVDRLASAAAGAGLSSIWVMHLLSFHPAGAAQRFGTLPANPSPLASQPTDPAPRTRRAIRTRMAAVRLRVPGKSLVAMAG